MALDVNQLAAGRVLRESYERVCKRLQPSCAIAETVDITMAGKGCLTYQYILLTALVAKLTNPQIDMLSLCPSPCLCTLALLFPPYCSSRSLRTPGQNYTLTVGSPTP